MGSAAPLAMSYYPKAQETKPPLIANETAYLGDISSSDKTDPSAPISAGFYRLEKGSLHTSSPLPHLLLIFAGKAPPWCISIRIMR